MSKILQSLDADHSIYQYSDGFSFGTDAVLLSGFIRTRKNSVGAEFGTGTGIIPLLLSMHKEFKKIYALEIQKDYAELARENVAMNGFDHKVEIIEGNLKDAKKLLPFYADFVFTNPPYMKKETGKLTTTKKSASPDTRSTAIFGTCAAAPPLFCRIKAIFTAFTDLLAWQNCLKQ